MFFSAVFGIVSAMVGAGFASGREIMQFFSRYGPVSWGLVLLAAVITGWLMRCLMENSAGVGEMFPANPVGSMGRGILLLLYTAAGGAMTAAAGELSALTVPLVHARALGSLLTLCAGVFLSMRSLRALGSIGKLLIPLMLSAFFFCSRIPAEDASLTVSHGFPIGAAVVRLIGYCGLNVMLSAEVIREAGEKTDNHPRLILIACCFIGVMLCVGNGAMLPHAKELESAALPMVMLLRAYGKPGFYLSAVVLYLAVFSTLIAILRAMRRLIPKRVQSPGLLAGLLCGASSLLGFETIVNAAYAVLGWLGILLILGKKFFERGTKYHPASSIGRTPNKEDGNTR